ncbi:hypothetical protein [Desulfuromonas sp. CSMB_57]|uniref:hypothetical protein n=1 Tax=Desulfuromonas sp. CSMB_57 TaxID=2807629 RepID=UPI001CD69E30|nr:hypothetical protein [Desulfuromonas sp. CSMB_57]
MMKKLLVLLLLAAGTSTAHAGNVNVDLGIRIGNPYPPPVVVAPAPVVVAQPPLFLAPPGYGFYVAVGVPFDMFWVQGTYYSYHNRQWYRSPYYQGPWYKVAPRHLPPGLARRRHRDLVRIRDAEYLRYRKAPHRYHGQHYRPAPGPYRGQHDRGRSEPGRHHPGSRGDHGRRGR